MSVNGGGDSTEKPNRRLYERLELWSAAMLAVATLATAYSAYEATRWGGQQATRFTQASATRTESAKAQSRGFSLVTIDAGLFTQFAVAFSQGDVPLQQILRRRFFRDEFKKAFNAWLKLRPLQNPDAPDVPFQMKEYKLAALQKASRLEKDASRFFEEGREANQTADNYVLATIFFAAVLFFGGLSVKFRSQRLVVATLTFGSLMFCSGVARLATLPFL
ncbi:MAG: hypothetical protein FVQ78_06055 [Solirubrobacterales bacterium]|nr:hypothetical protein [Solirubrobacterales bacterium]